MTYLASCKVSYTYCTLQVYGHFSFTEINDGLALMQQNARAVFDWATHNGIELNVKKTKVMIFRSAQNLAMLPRNLPQIMISGSLIPYGDHVINLFVLMSPSLNWQPQIADITNNIYASQQLKFLSEIFK